MIFGFHSIVHIKLNEYPHSVIMPAIVNQDVVEGHFCQVRACNGQNNHPTWRLQEAAQNTIRYGQTTISRKSNTGTDGRKRKQTFRYISTCLTSVVGTILTPFDVRYHLQQLVHGKSLESMDGVYQQGLKT